MVVLWGFGSGLQLWCLLDFRFEWVDIVWELDFIEIEFLDFSIEVEIIEIGLDVFIKFYESFLFFVIGEYGFMESVWIFFIENNVFYSILVVLFYYFV